MCACTWTLIGSSVGDCFLWTTKEWVFLNSIIKMMTGTIPDLMCSAYVCVCVNACAQVCVCACVCVCVCVLCFGVVHSR